MPKRKVPLIPGEYFHVFNRGINKEIVFRNHQNYIFFMKKIREFLIPKVATIISYVLMPTHYHFLVKINSLSFPTVMGRFILSYTKAFNQYWQRSGALFEGRFKSNWVDSDEYILTLSRYIHLNPVTANLVKTPSDWPYSNYLDLITYKKKWDSNTNIIYSYFENVDPKLGYQHFVEDENFTDESDFRHLLFD